MNNVHKFNCITEFKNELKLDDIKIWIYSLPIKDLEKKHNENYNNIKILKKLNNEVLLIEFNENIIGSFDEIRNWGEIKYIKSEYRNIKYDVLKEKRLLERLLLQEIRDSIDKSRYEIIKNEKNSVYIKEPLLIKDSVILNPETAELNQLEGLKLALDKGYKNIAITILPSHMVEEIRNYPIDDDDVNVYILVAHTTGTAPEDVKMIFNNADIVTACASKHVAEYTDKYQPYYYGSKVPIFCASEEGHKLLDNRLKKIGKPLSNNNYPRNKSDIPHKLI